MTAMSQKPQSDDTAGGVRRSMTDAELDALQHDLRTKCPYPAAGNAIVIGLLGDADYAITTLRARLADANARADRAEFNAAQLTVMVGDDAVEQIEAAVAAQIEADAGIADDYVKMREQQIANEKAHAAHHVDVPQIMRWGAGKVQSECIASAIRAQPHDRTALDAAIRAAKVEAWKEAATWHESEAAGAMNSLHCGSENSEFRAANRLHDFHKASAAALLALIGEGV